MPVLPGVDCFIQRQWEMLSPEFQFCLSHPLAVGLWTSHLTALCDLGNRRLTLLWADVRLWAGKFRWIVMAKLQVEMAMLSVLV